MAYLNQHNYHHVPALDLRVNNSQESGWVPNNHNLFDSKIPLQISGVSTTFGFEAEYSPTYNSSCHLRLAKRHPESNKILLANTAEFPFLEEEGNTEKSGNWEVKSKPYSTLSQCLDDMRRIKNALRMNPQNPKEHLLKSFHLHIRFPTLVSKDMEEEFKAWVSRIGDVILFWRLQHRDISYALTSWSQHRNEVSNLHRRGTVRLQKFGSMWDIELRGFMSSHAKILQLTKIICCVIQKRQFFGFPDFQAMSTDPNQQIALAEFVKDHVPNHSIPKEIFDYLEQQTFKYPDDKKGRMNVVLFHLKDAPYFGDIEYVSIQKYNSDFSNDLVNKINSHLKSNRNNNNNAELKNIYYQCMKDWACRLKIHHMLLTSLFPNMGRLVGMEFEVVVVDPVIPAANKEEWISLVDKLSKVYMENNVPAVRGGYTSTSYHTWLLKPDSSIKPQGYEIVSPILFWDYALQEMGDILDVTKSLLNITTTVNDTCGLHIHIGLERFHIGRLKVLCINFLNFENAIDLFMPEQRRTNRFCRSNYQAVKEESKTSTNDELRRYILDAPSLVELIRRMNPRTIPNDDHSRRYYRLNLQRTIELRTAEFRQHEGTLDKKVAKLWCHFLMNFSKLHEFRDVPENPFEKLKLLFDSPVIEDEVKEYICHRVEKYSNKRFKKVVTYEMP